MYPFAFALQLVAEMNLGRRLRDDSGIHARSLCLHADSGQLAVGTNTNSVLVLDRQGKDHYIKVSVVQTGDGRHLFVFATCTLRGIWRKGDPC